MRKLHLAIPQYRSSHLSDPSSEINKIPVVNWSVEQVCDWVTSKSFKAYRAVFRDGLVNGQMLLTITPEILATNGIHNMYIYPDLRAHFKAVASCVSDGNGRWHRQAIMVAVQELKELLAKNASGVLVDQPNLERTCDVFIRFVFNLFHFLGGAHSKHIACLLSLLRAQLQARRRQRLRSTSQSVLSKSGHRRIP
jgi:hypothetical protein